MRPLDGTVCAVCGERVYAAYALPGADGIIRCVLCCRIAPPYAKAAAYGSYEGGLRELIHLLKYAGIRPAANVLGRMLAETMTALHPAISAVAEVAPAASAGRMIAVIPVPLHRSKRRERGFNQAELIARAALKSHALPQVFSLHADVLERQRETDSQIGLTAHQRRENLRGAFSVARSEPISGRDVLLVDDVLTTGSTAAECARVLLRAGAARVWVATVARTLKLASHYAETGAGQARSPVAAQEVPMARAVGT